ncbi:MAG: FAD-dependent monooxygenase [Proteobacteria bacterium]|nr:FAD-dependent monooxygenase [Pseudomonadota bacterium]
MFDVAIAGGSFAGLALALALAKSGGGGLEIAIIERGPLDPARVKPDARAFALSGGSVALLEAIGVWPSLAAEAQTVARIDITDSALDDVMRPVLLSYDPVLDGRAQMHILEAQKLNAALVAAVTAEPSLTKLAAAEIAGLTARPGSRAITLGDGSSIPARLVVAADGSRSQLRAAAGIKVVSASYAQQGIAAIVAHEQPHDGVATQHFLPAGPFALLPLPGNRSCITWSETEANAQRVMALDDDAFLDEAQRRAGWRLGALTLDGPRAAWPLRAQVARSLVAERLALIGDAARAVHPIAGQGVNLGFRDVAALAEAIMDGVRVGSEAGDQTILDRYERWRRVDGVQASAAFTALNALFSNDSTLLRGVRDTGLGIVNRLPGIKSLLVGEAAGLTGDVPRLLRGEAA